VLVLPPVELRCITFHFLSCYTLIILLHHIMWPHIIVTCPCSPRTICHVKSIRCHHHHHQPIR